MMNKNHVLIVASPFKVIDENGRVIMESFSSESVAQFIRENQRFITVDKTSEKGRSILKTFFSRVALSCNSSERNVNDFS